jgi:hypothetical protein
VCRQFVKETARRLKALFSLEMLPFAILVALVLTSVLCRAWLLAKPLFISHVSP